MPEAKDILGVPALLGFFVICAWVLIKLVPPWLANKKDTLMTELANNREVSLADIAVRDKEAQGKLAEAQAIGGLTEVMRASSETTEELKIFLRASMSQSDRTEKRMDSIEEELGLLKEAILSRQGAGK